MSTGIRISEVETNGDPLGDWIELTNTSSATIDISNWYLADNGGSASGQFKVVVNNLPPVLIAADNQVIDEGKLLDLSNSNGAPALALFLDKGFDNPLNPLRYTPWGKNVIATAEIS